MNYNTILDFYFSNRWISLGLPGLIFVATFIYQLKFSKAKSKKRHRCITGTNIVVIVLLFSTEMFLNPAFLGYGQPVGVLEVKCINSKLYVMDYLLSRLSGGGRFSGTSVNRQNRIHVIDAESGNKEQRFLIGKNTKFVGAKGDKVTISFSSDQLTYSATTGKLVEDIYTLETLPVLFPQLSAGVSSFKWKKDGENISIVSLDGKNWLLNSVTGSLKSEDDETGLKMEPEPVYKPTNQYFIDHYKIRLDNRKYGSDHLQLKGKNGNSGRLQIYNDRRSLLLKEAFFLDGEIKAINNKDSCFLLLHYETTEHKKFILSCISLNGDKILWELRQSLLNPDFAFEHKNEVQIACDEQNTKLFFDIAEEIFAVNMKDGKVLWRQKL